MFEVRFACCVVGFELFDLMRFGWVLTSGSLLLRVALWFSFAFDCLLFATIWVSLFVFDLIFLG